MELVQFFWPWCPDQYAVHRLRGEHDYVVPKSDRLKLEDPKRYRLSIFRNFIDADQSTEGVVAFSDLYGLLLEGDKMPVDDWLSYQSEMREAWLRGQAGDWTGAAIAFNKRSVGTLNTKLGSDPDDLASIRLILEPTSLLQLMWVEMALHLTNAYGLRQCGWCGSWFPYGKGTNRRNTAKFCSNRCRKDNFLKNKEKAGG